MQKGAVLTILLLAILIVLGGFFIFKKTTPPNQVSPKAEDKLNSYTNQQFNFEFKYTQDLIVKEDSEEEFNKRGNGNFRKNFTGYVGYEPGKFLGAVAVLDKDNNFDTNPFTVWVFDNPKNLSIETWHHDFWYYPFVWGDFTSLGKFDLSPKEDATVSGQVGKSQIIDYREGKPRFIYISKDEKIYLFRIIGEIGDQILSSFNFLK